MRNKIVEDVKMLPQPITEHRARIEQLHKQDRAAGLPGVFLPNAMEVKHPAASSWEWFWLFPGSQLATDPRSGIRRRHHMHDINICLELARASERAAITRCSTTLSFGVLRNQS